MTEPAMKGAFSENAAQSLHHQCMSLHEQYSEAWAAAQNWRLAAAPEAAATAAVAHHHQAMQLFTQRPLQAEAPTSSSGAGPALFASHSA